MSETVVDPLNGAMLRDGVPLLRVAGIVTPVSGNEARLIAAQPAIFVEDNAIRPTRTRMWSLEDLAPPLAHGEREHLLGFGVGELVEEGEMVWLAGPTFMTAYRRLFGTVDSEGLSSWAEMGGFQYHVGLYRDLADLSVRIARQAKRLLERAMADPIAARDSGVAEYAEVVHSGVPEIDPRERLLVKAFVYWLKRDASLYFRVLDDVDARWGDAAAFDLEVKEQVRFLTEPRHPTQASIRVTKARANRALSNIDKAVFSNEIMTDSDMLRLTRLVSDD